MSLAVIRSALIALVSTALTVMMIAAATNSSTAYARPHFAAVAGEMAA